MKLPFFRHDFLLGLRGLRREPVSAIITSFTLALGIGLCSTVFALLYGVFFRSHPIPEASRVLIIARSNPSRNVQNQDVGLHDFYDWREQQTSFEALAGVSRGTVNLAGRDSPERYEGGFVSANTFDVLGVRPVLGTGFRPTDELPGAPLTLLIGYSVWENRYARDSSVVGSSVIVNGEAATILGVMPKDFRFPEDQDIWVVRRDTRAQVAERGTGPHFQVIGRLKPRVARADAQVAMEQIAGRLAQSYPKSNAGWTISFQTFTEDNTGPELRAVFGGMQVATLFVLLIAIANVANLLLARATLRTREAAVRTAVGASRFRVVAPFFAETLVLSLLGAGLGLVIAYGGVTLFDGATQGVGKPYYMEFKLDAPILLFMLGITLVTALISGAAPAYYVLKTDVNATLKDEARGSGVLGGRFTKALVAAEIALSCALLIGAGLMVRSIGKLRAFDYPFETGRIFTARLGLFDTEYPDTAARRGFFRSLEQSVKSLPGARAAALSTSLPLSTGQNDIGFPGEAYGPSHAYPMARSQVISEGFFETYGVQLLRGRDFNDLDVAGGAPVAIINQSFAQRFYAGREALGQRFAMTAGRDSLGPWHTVIGVVPDQRMEGLDENTAPEGFYLALAQRDPRFVHISVATQGADPLTLAGPVRQVVQSLNPNLPIYEVSSMDEVIREESWFYYVFGTVFIVFGGAALFMATVGLYGVLAFSVSRRTRELGIRMALGASGNDVIRLVLRQGGKQLAAGLVVGLLIAYGLTRVIGILMFEVTPQDPPVFTIVVLTIAAVGFLASLVPARRATGVQPVVALRAE